jgi:hypothetical protein
MRHLASLLVLVLPFVVAAQNLSFPLHHRFIPSLYADTADTRWFHRGTVFIDLDSGAGRFEEASGTGGAVVLLGDEGEWYQVGLETGGDGIGPMSSTRTAWTASVRVSELLECHGFGASASPTGAGAGGGAGAGAGARYPLDHVALSFPDRVCPRPVTHFPPLADGPPI